MGKGIRLGKIFGIEIDLDYSWFLIFILITWSLASNNVVVSREWSPIERWGWALVTSLLFFGSVLTHELAHSLVSQAQGISVPRITLFVFGGAAQISAEPRRARDEFLMALAGPLTSLALAGVFGVGWFITQNTNSPVNMLTGWLASINAALAVFNLLPGFPLDGGRILRSIIWALARNLQLATRVAVGGGVVLSWLFILIGLWQAFGGDWVNGLWLAFIGWFLQGAAEREGQGAVLNDLLKGHTAREVMMTDCPPTVKQLTLDVFVEQVAIPSGRRCFPVMDGDKFLGLVTLNRIQDVPREKWTTMRIADVMIPPAELVTAHRDEDLTRVMEEMARADVNQLPVLDKGKFLGLVTRRNILLFLRSHANGQLAQLKLET